MAENRDDHLEPDDTSGKRATRTPGRRRDRSRQPDAPARHQPVHAPPARLAAPGSVPVVAPPTSPPGNAPRRRKGRLVRTRIQQRTLIKQAAFLAAFAVRGIVLQAAAEAGVHRYVVYEWLRDDPAFKAKYEQAREDAMDLLESEARRRAEVGWDEAVYQMGNLAGYVRKYDSNLMALLLKGRRGDVFRERVSTELDARVRAESNPLNLSDRELEDRILAEAQVIAARRLGAG